MEICKLCLRCLIVTLQQRLLHYDYRLHLRSGSDMSTRHMISALRDVLRYTSVSKSSKCFENNAFLKSTCANSVKFRQFISYRLSKTFRYKCFNPQMVLLSEKGAHGVSARCGKVCMLLPQRSQGGTLENFVAKSTTVASQTNPVSPVYMASSSQPASSNRQAMTAQPKLQKLLHAPPQNRKLTIPPTWAIRLKPLLVCA